MVRIGRAIHAKKPDADLAFNTRGAVLRGAQAAPQIGLLVLDTAIELQPIVAMFGAAVEGAGRMLLELHQQFDLITAKCLDFSKYRVIIISDRGPAASVPDYFMITEPALLQSQRWSGHGDGAADRHTRRDRVRGWRVAP